MGATLFAMCPICSREQLQVFKVINFCCAVYQLYSREEAVQTHHMMIGMSIATSVFEDIIYHLNMLLTNSFSQFEMSEISITEVSK